MYPPQRDRRLTRPERPPSVNPDDFTRDERFRLQTILQLLYEDGKVELFDSWKVDLLTILDKLSRSSPR